MTQPFDIEAMRKDMEAGTSAPWRAFFDEVTGIKASDGRVATCTQVTLLHRRHPGEVAANARRIACVPAMEAEILRLTAENERLREALEFYSDRGFDGYDVTVGSYGLSMDTGRIIKDGCEIARAALGDAP